MSGRRVLHLDAWSGISGDMLLAALLDTDRDGLGGGAAGLEEELRRAVSALGLQGATVQVLRDVEWGVACTRVRVDDGGAAPLRHLADMEEIIGGAALSEQVKRRALGAVRRLASVEAAVHDCSVDRIHFHEVGAVDTLVDVVGAFVLLEALGIDEVSVGPIPVGGGTVEIAHGRMGVPAPATARLLDGYQIVGGPEPRELTTPTGALLVAELQARGGGLPAMIPEKVGYGAGTMKLEHGPNLLRVVVGTRAAAPGRADGESQATYAGRLGGGDVVVELQTNLDDVSPEVVGHAIRRLRDEEALDVWAVPAQMKKDRPGVVLHALVRVGEEDRAAAILFEETGTLGLRVRTVTRHVASRGVATVTVEGADVRVKWGRWRGRLVSVAPEYEDCAAVAVAIGRPLKDVMQTAAAAVRGLLEQGGSPGSTETEAEEEQR